MLAALDFQEKCWRKGVRAHAAAEFRARPPRPVVVAPHGVRIQVRDLAHFDALMGTSRADMATDASAFGRER